MGLGLGQRWLVSPVPPTSHGSSAAPRALPSLRGPRVLPSLPAGSASRGNALRDSRRQRPGEVGALGALAALCRGGGRAPAAPRGPARQHASAGGAAPTPAAAERAALARRWRTSRRVSLRAAAGAWSEEAVDHFLRWQRIGARDGAAIRWFHAANSKARAAEAARSDVHMIEADVLLRGGKAGNGDPIMAHPPETDSDNTLQEWLEEIVNTNKGIKLDFKSLEAVRPSLELLEHVKQRLRRPVWINADILPGPNGTNAAVDAKGFLDIVTSFFPDITLSLGWTTGWYPAKNNAGYDWVMVKEMAQVCNTLSQPVTFPVRAALVRQSISELCWLMQQSDRYSLTVWTGKEDVYSVEDLLYIRENFDKSRVYYDILEPQNSEFKKATGVE
ncbi:protein FAM151B [Leptosomus discolor]